MPLDRQSWNQRILDSPFPSFLQSWEWGQMQARLHVPHWRLSLETEGKPLSCLIIKRPLPAGRCWLYAPRGPVLDPHALPQVWPPLVERIRTLAEAEQALFVRFDPPWPATVLPLPRELVPAEREVQPRSTLVLDLAPEPPALLAAMHEKTRYNIRVAAKHGVAVRFSPDPQDLELFLRLIPAVQARSAFRFHPPDYYRAMHAALAPSRMLEVGVAEHEGKVLAAHILITFGDTTTYAHGASSAAMRSLMAPHLLQWASIMRARAAGRAHYDFFGIAPASAGPQHPWAGITRFKLGFGGRREEYIGAYDDVRDRAWYTTFTIVRRVRKLWR